MKVMAYINFLFAVDKINAMLLKDEDTLTKLRKGLDECSTISGLVEMHFVYGRDPAAFAAIAKVEVEDIMGITHVINEIKKVFPVKDCTTLIVQPQLRVGETPKDLCFV